MLGKFFIQRQFHNIATLRMAIGITLFNQPFGIDNRHFDGVFIV
jgi:predicted RNA methylase